MFKIIKLIAPLFILIVLNNNIFAADISNCRSCHAVSRIDDNHNFKCINCHLIEKYRSVINSHKNIIKNPSSLKYVGILCAKCHKSDIKNLLGSLHGTLAGAIAITRFIWGAQSSLMPEYGIMTAGKIKRLPDHSLRPGKKPLTLVNDFLRRKCLRCHLYNDGTDDKIGASGLYRGTGCASCHMKFGQDGRYEGIDSLMKGKKVYSETHKFLKIPPMANCLSCHNTEFIGTDYKGLFPHDYAYSFNSPILPSGNFPNNIYGIGFHHLISDIHYRKGLTCVDCHRKTDVMGDGNFYSSEMQKGAVKVSCNSCHGGFGSKPDLKWVTYKDGNYYFKSMEGRIYRIRRFKAIMPHEPFHKNLACSACHSVWQNENYGLNLFRDDKAEYKMWKNLTSQEDPYLENFLSRVLKETNKNISLVKPEMPDRITGKMYDGIWYSGWIMRRWNYFTLGMTDYGKIKILRPMFEYRLTYIDKAGNLIINNKGKTNGKAMSGFIPYDPHTTTLYGKSCQSCHENNYILNKKKLEKKATVVKLFYGHVIHGSNLPKEVLKRMQSSFYKKTAAKRFYKKNVR